MRITPVTGDLPVVAADVRSGPPQLRLVDEPPAAPVPTVVAPADVAGHEPDADAQARRGPAPRACFDPPLIAQRAVLGLPVGPMIADLARAQGISYGAASAAVDREMPLRPQSPGRSDGPAAAPPG
jgi:hypothetical protein